MSTKIKHFLIQFDQAQRSYPRSYQRSYPPVRPSSVFLPGDVVSGHLIVDLSEQITFKKIKVKVVGKAKVEWTKVRQTFTCSLYLEKFNYKDKLSSSEDNNFMNVALKLFNFFTHISM